MHQRLARQPALRVTAREIVRREAALLEERHRQRVAERERGRGARRRREVERTGFLRDASVEVHIRLARER